MGGSSSGLAGREGGGGRHGGAAGLGGGGLEGATSRLSVMSLSSSKLSWDSWDSSLAESFLNLEPGGGARGSTGLETSASSVARLARQSWVQDSMSQSTPRTVMFRAVRAVRAAPPSLY